MSAQEIALYGLSGAIVFGGLAFAAVALRQTHQRDQATPVPAWNTHLTAARERYRHHRPDTWLTVLRRTPSNWYPTPPCEPPGRHSREHFELITDHTQFTQDQARTLNELLEHPDDEQRDCAHHWPGDLLPDAECTSCGLLFSEFEPA